MENKLNGLWKEKEYLKVMSATFITRIGDGIDMIAFAWLVYEITGSTLLVATICGVNMIPNLTVGFVSGVICKYIDEKKIMYLCDFGRAICVAIIALLYLQGGLAVWHLFVITFLNSCFEAFRAPAQTSVFPKILSSEHLEKGLAIQQSLVGAANLLGMCAAPVCIAAFGLGGAVIVDALSFLLCGLIILTMKKVKVMQEANMSVKQCWNDFVEGLRYTKNDKLLVNICIFACLVNALMVPIAIFEAPFIKDYLHMGSEGMAIIGTMQILGMILISPFIPKLKNKISYRNMFVYGGALVGIGCLLYAGTPLFAKPYSYVVLALGCFFVGALLACVNFPLQIAMYERVDQSYLARFSAVMTSLSLAAQPIASFVFGGLSDILPLDMIYVLCGLFALVCFFTQKWNKVLFELNRY